ncbi:tetratricopeptide repeat protein [Lacinutrix undariae]
MRYLIFIILICFSVKTNAQIAVLNYADSLYTSGNYSKAITSYKSLNNTNMVLSKIAKAYYALGNYDEALNFYAKSIAVYPDDALLKYDYAKLLYKTKKYEAAAEKFNDLVYIDYKNPNYHYELGLSLEALKDSSAFNRFKSAYDLDKTHQKAIYKMARFYVKKRKYDSAESYINIGLESYKNNVALISLKAQNFYNQHDYKSAIIWFEKLINLGEVSEFIHEKLSLSYAQQSDYENAIIQRKLALKYDPHNARALYVLGTYYEKLNDFKTAETYIKKYLALSDRPLDVEYAMLGAIYNRQEKYKEAISCFKIAVKENPENDSAAFFEIASKDRYYKDIDTKIKLYKNFKIKYPKSFYILVADQRLAELKEEKFMNAD